MHRYFSRNSIIKGLKRKKCMTKNFLSGKFTVYNWRSGKEYPRQEKAESNTTKLTTQEKL